VHASTSIVCIALRVMLFRSLSVITIINCGELFSEGRLVIKLTDSLL
jgi:hypothetical protein